MIFKEKLIYKIQKIMGMIILLSHSIIAITFSFFDLNLGIYFLIITIPFGVAQFFVMKHIKFFEYDEYYKKIKINNNFYLLNDIKSISLKKIMPFKETFIIFTNDSEYWIQNKHFKNKDFIQMKEILEKIKKELDNEKK
ncbi:MAG: hypothetical protein JW924_02945 [Fusobacteriaceae bacterium]|nr:hypothetical protein [Fusobacteriaceae bacterium]